MVKDVKENSNVVDLNAFRLKKELQQMDEELKLMATDPAIIQMIDELVSFLNETYYNGIKDHDDEDE